MLCIVSATLGVAIILYNLESNITFFVTPTQIINMSTGKELRLGGIVKSIKKIDIKTVSFKMIDDKNEIEVLYQGILPALFREKQGIIAIGIVQNKSFIARELLVKHDENYRPPDITK